MKLYNDEYYTGLGDELATEVIGSREAHPSIKEIQAAVEARRSRIKQIEEALPLKYAELDELREENAKDVESANKYRADLEAATDKAEKEAILKEYEKRVPEYQEIEKALSKKAIEVETLEAELEDLQTEEDKYLEEQEKTSGRKRSSKKRKPSKAKRQTKRREAIDEDDDSDDDFDDSAYAALMEELAEETKKLYAPKSGETKEETTRRIAKEAAERNKAAKAAKDDADKAPDETDEEDDVAAPPVRKVDSEIVIANHNVKKDDEEDEDMLIDLAQTTKALKEDEVAVALAQVQATNGKVVPAVLKPFVSMIIANNKETREAIAVGYESIMREFPELLDGYRQAVNDLSKDHRIKWMTKCPINNKLYESEDLAYADLDKDDILALHKGLWSFEDAWLKLDENGEPIDVLKKAAVIKKIQSLPEEIQAAAYDELHIEKPKKAAPADAKSDKDDASA